MCNQGKCVKINFKKEYIIFSKCCALENKDIVYKLPYEEFQLDYDYLMEVANRIPQNFKTILRSEDCNGDCSDCFQNQKIESVAISLENCNLDCIMCGCSRTNPGKFQTECFYNTFEILKKHNVGVDLNLNGELFLQKERAFKILSSIEEDDFKYIHIITNGTLLSSADIVKLQLISKKVDLILTFSIDSFNPETYMQIRRNSTLSMFTNVIKNVKLSKKIGIYTDINVTLVDINSTKKELDDMVNFSKKYNFKLNVIIADTLEEKYHYLFNDANVKEFIQKMNVDYRIV